MKKVFILTAFIAAILFTNCEKEELLMPLSEFIIGGNWVYNDSDIVFTVSFYEDGTYDLLVSDTIEFDGEYSINNKLNQMNIEAPDFDNINVQTYTVFDIEWQKGIEEMYWSEPADLSGNVMTWIRN